MAPPSSRSHLPSLAALDPTCIQAHKTLVQMHEFVYCAQYTLVRFVYCAQYTLVHSMTGHHTVWAKVHLAVCCLLFLSIDTSPSESIQVVTQPEERNSRV